MTPRRTTLPAETVLGSTTSPAFATAAATLCFVGLVMLRPTGSCARLSVSAVPILGALLAPTQPRTQSWSSIVITTPNFGDRRPFAQPLPAIKCPLADIQLGRGFMFEGGSQEFFDRYS